MTTEDKRLISEYMGWFAHPQGFWYDPPVYFTDSFRGKIKFNLDDAGLCIKEMQRHGDWDDFISYTLMICFKVTKIDIWPTNFFAWLFNADNFFESMAKWLKEEKK